MPRRPRPDIQPEILIPDVRYQERLANSVIDDTHQARVRPKGSWPINDVWTNIFGKTNEVLSRIREDGGVLDEALVFFMMINCAKAVAVPVTGSDSEPLVRQDHIVYRLLKVGCRVYMTQEQIANKLGQWRSTINSKIREMKRYGLIVNSGHGWFEFSSENKTGEKYNNTVFVSWGFKNDKLAWEWAIYNAANSPKPYKQ